MNTNVAFLSFAINKLGSKKMNLFEKVLNSNVFISSLSI